MCSRTINSTSSFAVDEDGAIYTLQARPLFVRDDAPYFESDVQVGRTVDSIARTLAELSGRRHGQVGEGCMWSIMSDWNPAEIIVRVPVRWHSTCTDTS